jgi:hypothetical protein
MNTISPADVKFAVDTDHNRSLFYHNNELKLKNQLYAIAFGIIPLKEIADEKTVPLAK